MNRYRITVLFLLIGLSTISIHTMKSDADGDLYFEEITFGVPIEGGLATNEAGKSLEDYTVAYRLPIPRESNFEKLKRLFSVVSISTNFVEQPLEAVKPKPIRSQQKIRNQKSAEDGVREEEKTVNLLKAQREAALIGVGALQPGKYNF